MMYLIVQQIRDNGKTYGEDEFMDPISLILAALGTGATTMCGIIGKDAYNGLKASIKRKFESQGKTDSATILDKYEQKPEKTKALLEDELTEVGADKDEEIIKPTFRTSFCSTDTSVISNRNSLNINT
jgi:hypothetical protein